MPATPRHDKDGRGAYARSFPFTVVGFVALATLAGLTWIATRAALKKPAKALVVDPPEVHLADRVYKKNDVVKSSFRITNPLKRPVKVKMSDRLLPSLDYELTQVG